MRPPAAGGGAPPAVSFAEALRLWLKVGLLGFDFDGATFTHVGDKVTFEVVAESFGLHQDAALARLATLVHFIDIGGVPVDEAPGFEMLVRGLQAQHGDDDALLAAALPLLDACYAALQVPHDH